MSTEPQNHNNLGGFMKRIASIWTGISFVVMFFIASANAQHDGQTISANIPFEFTVGSISFAAGHYEFLHSGDNVVVVRDTDVRSRFTLASAWIQENGIPAKALLRFTTVGGRHVLTQMWNDRAATGSEFPTGHAAMDREKP
jgi:hypothetical protein